MQRGRLNVSEKKKLHDLSLDGIQGDCSGNSMNSEAHLWKKNTYGRLKLGHGLQNAFVPVDLHVCMNYMT